MIVYIMMGGVVYEWDCSFLYEDGDEPYTFEENQ